MPAVEKLGDSGCLLTGDEIVKVLGDNGPRIAYNSESKGNGQAPNGAKIVHVGLFKKGHGSTGADRFVEGWYDGVVQDDKGEEKPPLLKVRKAVESGLGSRERA